LITLSNLDIVHRDIRLENVFMDKDANIKINNFSSSEVGKFFDTLAGIVFVAYVYLFFFIRSHQAPEVIMVELKPGSKYNKSCDMWSVGVVMYEVCWLFLRYLFLFCLCF
jgi:serine/threonine protein kinase